MRLKLFLLPASLPLVLALTCSASTVSASAPPTDLPVSHFVVNDKTQIPGITLSSGTYLIRVFDHLSDRMILKVENDKGKLLSTFLALPNSRLLQEGGSGAILYGSSKKNEALRGFAFDNGTTVEFVYPKAQAVAIARQNSTKVPAIDPPSEGLPLDSKLSKDDMTLVTLWLLSPTRVGSESKPIGVLAQRYKPENQNVSPVQIAQSQPATAVGQNSAAQTYSQPVAPQTSLVAKATRQPVIARLPHTAGPMPSIWLLGLSSLTGALLLRRRLGRLVSA